MTDRRHAQITSRKRPQQARAKDLVATLLEAAVQVLAQEGAQRFTTTRVAEKAGVSIGSVYQYFPNKASILFRLQSDEWQQTGDLLARTLDEVQQPPLARLRRLVHVFVASECAEAQLRTALHDAAPLYRDAPEAKQARAAGRRRFERFMREALPDAAPASRALAGELIMLTLSAVAKSFSGSPRGVAEIEAWSEAMADMLCAYLSSLGQAHGAGPGHLTGDPVRTGA